MSDCYEAVMFDLDGTLLNTLPAIANAANHMMSQLGLPTRPRDDWKPLIGHGLRYLVNGSVGAVDGSLVQRAEEVYVSYYEAHGIEQTTIFPGIVDLLEMLVSRGTRIAVCSNKPDWATREAVEKMLGRFDFDAVLGQVEGTPVKPDPSMPHAIADRLEIGPDRWLYVGDSDVDMQTAVNAAMFGVGVSWGYRSVDDLNEHGASHIIDEPLGLLELL